MFAIAFAGLAVFAVGMTLARRTEEPLAGTIATFYGVGFGLAAVSEFMMFMDLAFKVSLAAALAMSASLVNVFAVAAVIVAVSAVGIAVTVQFDEEGVYRAAHRLAQ
ncbi:MAG TPA: hypothetical protein VF725_03660 [Ktedonobacterales bacterium]